MKISTQLAKYKFFGLKIGVGLDEIKNIETNNKDSESCLLEMLSSRLKRKPALTCNDIDKALRSRTVDEHTLADDVQSDFECKSVPEPQNSQIEIRKEYSKKGRAAKPTESDFSLKMSKKESKRNIDNKERTQYYAESDDGSKSDEAGRSAEVERQVHVRDEPKSKRAKKRARKKVRTAKNQCASEQPASESAGKLKKEIERSKRIEYVESEDKSKSDESENMKSAEVERQVHERDEPKSK